MKKAAIIPVITVSAILLIYTILSALGTAPNVILFIFALSPFLMVWMVLSVIRYGKFTGKELRDDQHWGYEDREDLNPSKN
jgi:hypothetical protein